MRAAAARQTDPQISPLSSTASTIYSLVKYCQWWKTFHDKKCRNIIVQIFCCFRLRGGWLQRAGRAGGRGRGAGLQVLPRAGEQPRHPLLDPLLRRRQAARQRGHRGHALQHRIHVSTVQYSKYSTFRGSRTVKHDMLYSHFLRLGIFSCKSVWFLLAGVDISVETPSFGIIQHFLAQQQEAAT